jgi:hypothetical protein
MRGNIAIYIAIYIMVNLLRENANDISSLYLADIYIYIYIYNGKLRENVHISV